MDLGELVVSIRMRTEALERGLNETQRKLQQQQQEAKRTAASMQELENSYTTIALTASVAFAGVVAAVMSGINAYNQYTSTMKGFENQIKSTGQSITEAKNAMSELSSDGLISEADTAAAIKNLVNYGFSVEKAQKTVQALKDTSVDNRQAHYTLGQAVRVTTEGIRMENSVLSDAAGIQKNIAKMVEEYAKSIGKKTDELTKSEKAEAIYQGVMEESIANMGRAAEYASELGGRQAQLDATTQKLAQGYGTALAPVVQSIIGLFQPLLKFISSLVKEYPQLTAVITVLIGTLALLAAGIGVVTAAKIAWTTATNTLGVALSRIMLNPLVLGLTALVGVVALVSSTKAKAAEETRKLAEAEKEYNRVVEEGIQLQQVDEYEKKVQKLKELKTELDQIQVKLSELRSLPQDTSQNTDPFGFNTNSETADEIEKYERQLKGLERQLHEIGSSSDLVTKQIEAYTAAIKRAKIGTADQVNEQAKQVAMQNREVLQIENLLKQYNSAKEGSSEWNQAQSELARMFPQFSSAIGINEKAIAGLLIVKRQEVATAWQSVQAKAAEIIIEKKKEIAVAEAALKAVDAGLKWAFGMGLSAKATKGAREEIEKLKGEVDSLTEITKIDPSKMVGVDPVVPKISGSDANENKALDNAYRSLEHKKRLNQLTLEDELKTLETIKAKHVKTAEERMEIEEKLYDVRSRLMNQSMDDALNLFDREKQQGLINVDQEISHLEQIKKKYADTAEDLKKLDEMIFEAKQRKLEDQKQLEADILDRTIQGFRDAYEDLVLHEGLTTEQRFDLQKKMYDAIKAENEKYLQSILSDDRYTAKEKEQIQREITSEIRQNINERLQLEKDYYAELRKQEIDSINNLSQGLQAALREKYQAEKEIEENRIRGLIDTDENWRRYQLDIIKNTYDDRIKEAEKATEREIELINQTYNAQIKVIQDELTALDEAEKQKTRAELNAEDQKKIDRLKAMIEYEHDEFNKAQLQKELNKLLADQEKRHQEEQLQDKKDTLKAQEKSLQDKLKEETDLIKSQLDNKKEMLQEDRDREIEIINSIHEAQKISYNNQLEETRKHYDSLLTARSLQAEAEKMIVDNQQKEIITLLDGYGDSYQLTGQTLGEKLYAGFKEKVSQITALINSVNTQIDSARNAAIAAMNSVSTSGAQTALSSTVDNSKTVTVQNNFNTPVTSPSDVSRATKKAAQALLEY